MVVVVVLFWLFFSCLFMAHLCVNINSDFTFTEAGLRSERALIWVNLWRQQAVLRLRGLNFGAGFTTRLRRDGAAYLRCNADQAASMQALSIAVWL